VLHCPNGADDRLDDLVEAFITAAVELVAVVGPDASRIEDIIDEIVVGVGDRPERFLITTAHPNETVDQVVAFARSFRVNDDRPVQVVVL
jgi:hypothetical protein